MFPKKVTDENFVRLILQSEGKIFLVVGTQWCPDTRNLLEIMTKIPEEENPGVEFYYAKIEGKERGQKLNPLIHGTLEIERYPTIFGFVGGKIVARKLTEERLEQEKDVRELLETLNK